MKPSHIYAIIRKQLKDTFRNKPTLVQFVMFPAIAAILTLSAGEFELPKRYFVNLFSVMYVCMARFSSCLRSSVRKRRRALYVCS